MAHTMLCPFEVARLFLIAHWVRTILFLILLLGLWAAIIHGLVILGRRARRRYQSAARIDAATAAASCSSA